MTQPGEKEGTGRRVNSREALLAVSERLFTEKGYGAVSTRELAEAAGVNLGAIQYHFGSKAKLFIATLQRMMESSVCTKATLALSGPCSTQEEAGVLVCRFVRSFMHYLLRHDGPQACRLMFREILSDSANDEELSEALVSTFVERFVNPLESSMLGVLAVFHPEASEDQLRKVCRSIVGQCAFYVTHRPFIERLQGASILEPQTFEGTVDHVCRFSLRALGCAEDTIESIVERDQYEATGGEDSPQAAFA